MQICGHQYEFRPVYASDVPRIVPPRRFVRGLSALLSERAALIGRYVLVAIVWLFLVPLITSWMWHFHTAPSSGEWVTIGGAEGEVVGWFDVRVHLQIGHIVVCVVVVICFGGSAIAMFLQKLQQQHFILLLLANQRQLDRAHPPPPAPLIPFANQGEEADVEDPEEEEDEEELRNLLEWFDPAILNTIFAFGGGEEGGGHVDGLAVLPNPPPPAALRHPLPPVRGNPPPAPPQPQLPPPPANHLHGNAVRQRGQPLRPPHWLDADDADQVADDDEEGEEGEEDDSFSAEERLFRQQIEFPPHAHNADDDHEDSDEASEEEEEEDDDEDEEEDEDDEEGEAAAVDLAEFVGLTGPLSGMSRGPSVARPSSLLTGLTSQRCQ